MKDIINEISDPEITEIYATIGNLVGFVPNGRGKICSTFPSMASRIEHTLLNMVSAEADVRRVCTEALEHGFRAVCCLPKDVVLCSMILDGSKVKVVTVIDFPLGCGTSQDRMAQCKQLVKLGADEVDMVIDVRSIIEQDYVAARDNIVQVVSAAEGRPVKVILETGYLNAAQIVAACVCAEAGGASFVKTCTGFGPRGATISDVELMRRSVKNRMAIKAAGGIKTKEDMLAMVAAGADVIGASRSIQCI